jgi:hypothetical protein
MKKINIMFVLLLTPLMLVAQRQTENREYNRKGDEAKNALDYSSAKVWYEQGVVSECDIYSIRQLTTIWRTEKSVRMLMRSVMNKCLNCLDERATLDSDTTSMRLLILYYTEGIGTQKNEAKAEIWKRELASVTDFHEEYNRRNVKKPDHKKVKMQFFAGYTASYYAPFGLTVGGVGRTVGWYLRYRTNLSFQDYTETCDENGHIVGGLSDALPSPLSDKPDKINSWAATGGWIFKLAPVFHLSVGAGYCERKAIYRIEKIGIAEATSLGSFWAKCNDETSFGGVALDLDGTFRLGKTFYGSVGCSMLNFKYASANLGIGVFF